MKIYQMLSSLSYGDAIGNVVLAMKRAIEEMGYETAVYAESVDKRIPEGTAVHLQYRPEFEEEDIVIYHLSNGSVWNRRFGKLNCKKIVYYHNITPPEFFGGYNLNAQLDCHSGLKDAAFLADKVDYCLAVSEFNRQDLISMGYKQKIDVLPILIPYDDYTKKPDQKIIKKYSDGRTNILFTGRVSPNKKLEDVIKAFYYYKNYMDSTARLFFVGRHSDMEHYYSKLQEYAKSMELEDVYFTGHIRFDEILAYYQIADVFVCMSEHEGFCVPLVEAMYFGIPIAAYKSSAVPDTLGNGGLLTDDKDPKLVAEMIQRLVQDKELREQIVKHQKEQLERFEYKKVMSLFEQYLKTFLGDTK